MPDVPAAKLKLSKPCVPNGKVVVSVQYHRSGLPRYTQCFLLNFKAIFMQILSLFFLIFSEGSGYEIAWHFPWQTRSLWPMGLRQVDRQHDFKQHCSSEFLFLERRIKEIGIRLQLQALVYRVWSTTMHALFCSICRSHQVAKQRANGHMHSPTLKCTNEIKQSADSCGHEWQLWGMLGSPAQWWGILILNICALHLHLFRTKSSPFFSKC